MADIKITKPTFKKTEAEWFNYHQTVKDIKLLEDAIMHPYKEHDNNIGGGKTNILGDPTYRTASRLTRHKQLNYLREIASAIETVYNELPEDHKRLVHVRYWARESYTWDEIIGKCNVSRRQAFRWRDSIIHATIEVLGWR